MNDFRVIGALVKTIVVILEKVLDKHINIKYNIVKNDELNGFIAILVTFMG